MQENNPDPGRTGRRQTFQQLKPQMRQAFADAVARHIYSPVILAVDVTHEKLHRLMLSITDTDRMYECVVRSQKMGLFPVVLVDVPAADMRRALGGRAQRAASWLSREAGAHFFRAAVLDNLGISWGRIRR